MNPEGDDDAVLRAADRLRTALTRLCEHLQSGTREEVLHENLVKEVEEATQEFRRHWVRRRGKRSRKDGRSWPSPHTAKHEVFRVRR